ncbi:Nif3-like dinuclear metal center hexameric protein [Paenibacillus alkalitolerans]|uniref:Nif3-like dinuclear metal center hexameric protein n=1 Tax=Paenibacillus alkalitolerans TaxID=2799335 RepID=UPI0018F3D61B|nr:Nif3-like dinuclear metal center hexameric protein [Paenibacillus alkalitolerans]
MSITVQDVIDALTLPGGNPEGSVDELLSGDCRSEVTGIVACFMPTLSVLDKAAELGANLIVAHEGLFFSHHKANVFEDSEVFQEKKRRIDASGVAIYRCHDYWHRCIPDGITEGLVQTLGWGSYIRERHPSATIVEIPPAAVREIASNVKECLGVSFLRAMGDPEMVCRRIGVFAGYRGGGQTVIPLFEKEGLDLVLYGEGPEWETPEYIRDSLYMGRPRALIVLGHGESEEPGMSALADRLRGIFPSVPVRYLKEDSLFRIL